MLHGFNHNIRYRDRVFHVQTEDHGLKQATFVTQVFLDGRIVHLERTSYRDELDKNGEGAPDDLRMRMQEQHKDQLRRLVRGEFDGRITLCPEEAPESTLPTAREDVAGILTIEPADAEEPSAFLEALDEEMARQKPLSPSLPSVLQPPPRSPSSAFGDPRAGRRNPNDRWEDRVPPSDTLVDFGIPGSLRDVLRARLRSPSRVLKTPLPAGVSPPLPAGATHERRRAASRAHPSSARPSSSRNDPSAPRPPNPEPIPPDRPSEDGAPSLAAPAPPRTSGQHETMLELDAGALKREIEAQREQLRAIRCGTIPVPVSADQPPRAWSLDDTFLTNLFDDE